MWQSQREHYDRHAQPHLDKQHALAMRQKSATLPLKRFHNDVKRYLINTFASGKDRLLDLACGRGGDLQKWRDAGVKQVKGVDISEKEIEEAWQRYAGLDGRDRIQVDFESTDVIGMQEWKDSQGPFDVVTCMFAAQYFYASEATLFMFLSNVAKNLKRGGVFLGTVPDGKRVLSLVQKGPYESPYLRVTPHWKGPPQTFGCAYQCEITDTVTDGNGGVLEYLVFFTAFKAIAANVGLVPITDYTCDMFEGRDADESFKHFDPKTLDSGLRPASSMFAAFAFRKV